MRPQTSYFLRQNSGTLQLLAALLSAVRGTQRNRHRRYPWAIGCEWWLVNIWLIYRLIYIYIYIYIYHIYIYIYIYHIYIYIMAHIYIIDWLIDWLNDVNIWLTYYGEYMMNIWWMMLIMSETKRHKPTMTGAELCRVKNTRNHPG